MERGFSGFFLKNMNTHIFVALDFMMAPGPGRTQVCTLPLCVGAAVPP